jgi:steroid 5-alpha reductase family enzyme
MWHILLLSLGISLLINLAMFLVAFWLCSDKLTDISYAVSFIVLVGVAFAQGPNSYCLYDYLLTALVTVWGVRIGGFLLYRVMKKGKDGRFDGVREHFSRFGTFWLGQAFTVWLLMLPVSLALQQQAKFGVLTYGGVLIWFIGLLVESAADAQKYRFNANPKHKGRWIEQGVWRYSRHPNYFGEIAVWIGVYLYSLTVLRGGSVLIGLVSPVFITILLRFVSGIPILEKSADTRWGSDPNYQAYKRRTNLLIPWPKK